MMFEPIYLSLFLFAAVCGVARFRGQARWDRLSLLTSFSASVSGSVLMGLAAVTSESSLLLIPLSLLIMMHAATFLFRNYFLQMMCLPIIVAEILGSYFFVDLEPRLSKTGLLLAASVVHLLFLGGLLKVIRNLDGGKMTKPTLWSPYALALHLGAGTKISQKGS